MNITNDTFTNRSKILLGFFDIVAVGSPVDGAYFEISTNSTDVVVAAATANNSVYNYTANFSLATKQPDVGKGGVYLNYRLNLSPNADAVTYAIYNDSNVLLWNATLQRTATAGVPVINGRETGAGVFMYRFTAGTVKNIGRIDYMVAEIPSLGRPFG